MIDLDTVQSLTHCLFGLYVKQQDNRIGVSTEKAHIRQQTNNIVSHNSPYPTPHSQWLLDNTPQNTASCHPIGSSLLHRQDVPPTESLYPINPSASTKAQTKYIQYV
jgi:hypothetical protein